MKSDLQNAQREVLAACVALEQTSSALASLPHYMAIGLNTMTTKGIEASMSALATTYFPFCALLIKSRTNLMLTGVEELVLYMVDTYKSLS
jgi:hypothetical protein